MKKESTLIFSCLASAAAGVIIGMLLSDDTRRSLQETTKKISERLINRFSVLENGATDVKNHVEDKLNDPTSTL